MGRPLAAWAGKAVLIAWAGLVVVLAMRWSLVSPPISSDPYRDRPWQVATPVAAVAPQPVAAVDVAAVAATAAAQAATEAEARIAWQTANRETELRTEIGAAVATEQAAERQRQARYLTSLLTPRARAQSTPPGPPCADGLAVGTTCVLPTVAPTPTPALPACDSGRSEARPGPYRVCTWTGTPAPTSTPLPSPSPGVGTPTPPRATITWHRDGQSWCVTVQMLDSRSGSTACFRDQTLTPDATGADPAIGGSGSPPSSTEIPPTSSALPSPPRGDER